MNGTDPTASAVTATEEPSRSGVQLADALVVAFATAEDASSGIDRVVRIVRDRAGARGVEWWVPTDDGLSFRREAAVGDNRGERVAVPLGAAGALVIVGPSDLADLAFALAEIGPLAGRRRSEERLLSMTPQLLRRYEALDDFAALVAHELKTALATGSLERARQIVDEILEVAKAGSSPDSSASVAECIEAAVQDLGGTSVVTDSTLPEELPLSAEALRIVLRNLISNAAAAGAERLHLSAVAHGDSWHVAVDDDGIGIDDPDHTRYASGSRLGFGLCRRIVERADGFLELGRAPAGGARATLVLPRR
jgi:signal transduction histidine kinase